MAPRPGTREEALATGSLCTWSAVEERLQGGQSLSSDHVHLLFFRSPVEASLFVPLDWATEPAVSFYPVTNLRS